ncbi:MAG: ATP-binding protein [Planctomycetota bacterium]|nr:ATP-binding protein [Planctomycetota bacterium]
MRASPVTALLGPRQCGKTTLARCIARERRCSYVDLENPLDAVRLENPMRALAGLRGVVVIDEVQRQPGLFAALRVLADRRPMPARFLILGSASPELRRRTAETLAGRVRFVDMGGFSLEEAGGENLKRLWYRGGFPRAYLARSAGECAAWREDFVRTFLERDIPQLAPRIPAVRLRRFWTMIAHYHGQIWNGSEIAGSLGMAHTTSRDYVDLLTGAFVVRQLQPWFENVGKRLVRAPKVYVRDSGLLHTLLRVPDLRSLEAHPKLGASWEGFGIEQVLALSDARDAYFWATHGGAELDLLLLRKGKRWGFEFKCGDAPKMTKSLHSALADLRLEHAWVVYPGSERYSVHDSVEVLPASELPEVLDRLG